MPYLDNTHNNNCSKYLTISSFHCCLADRRRRSDNNSGVIMLFMATIIALDIFNELTVNLSQRLGITINKSACRNTSFVVVIFTL